MQRRGRCACECRLPDALSFERRSLAVIKITGNEWRILSRGHDTDVLPVLVHSPPPSVSRIKYYKHDTGYYYGWSYTPLDI